MDYITDRIAVGGISDALEPPLKITALLNVAMEHDIKSQGRLYKKIPLPDMREAPVDLLYKAVEWIEQNEGENKILVSCHAGIGRSPSVVIAYLCCVKGMGFDEAVEYVARRRHAISPLPNLNITIGRVKEIRKNGYCPPSSLSSSI